MCVCELEGLPFVYPCNDSCLAVCAAVWNTSFLLCIFTLIRKVTSCSFALMELSHKLFTICRRHRCRVVLVVVVAAAGSMPFVGF